MILSFFSSHEPKAYSIVVEPACVRASVRPFTFKSIFFSETAWPMKAKFSCGASMGSGNESLFAGS